jgi:hypothetical protein
MGKSLVATSTKRLSGLGGQGPDAYRERQVWGMKSGSRHEG